MIRKKPKKLYIFITYILLLLLLWTSLMIEKYLRHKITRTDLEKRTLERSLQDRYAKYSGKKVIDSLLLKKEKEIDTTEVSKKKPNL